MRSYPLGTIASASDCPCPCVERQISLSTMVFKLLLLRTMRQMTGTGTRCFAHFVSLCPSSYRTHKQTRKNAGNSRVSCWVVNESLDRVVACVSHWRIAADKRQHLDNGTGQNAQNWTVVENRFWFSLQIAPGYSYIHLQRVLFVIAGHRVISLCLSGSLDSDVLLGDILHTQQWSGSPPHTIITVVVVVGTI